MHRPSAYPFRLQYYVVNIVTVSFRSKRNRMDTYQWCGAFERTIASIVDV